MSIYAKKFLAIYFAFKEFGHIFWGAPKPVIIFTDNKAVLQEIRQRYYYHSMAKHGKKWVEGCEQCAKDKRVPNATITPELLNLPEWDLGPEDAMHIDLLPNLPPSGGYEKVLTAVDVFSQYQLSYPLADASAINVAKVLIDIMTKDAYLQQLSLLIKELHSLSRLLRKLRRFWTLHSNVQRQSTRKRSGSWSEHMHNSRQISRWHVWSIAENGINICRLQFSIITRVITPVSIVK